MICYLTHFTSDDVVTGGLNYNFYWKIEEKQDQKKSLAVWFPAYLLYLPSNLKS